MASGIIPAAHLGNARGQIAIWTWPIALGIESIWVLKKKQVSKVMKQEDSLWKILPGFRYVRL